MNFLKTLGK